MSTVVLLIYVHGFKGGDSTFAQFPDRLQHMLSDTIPHATFETIVFPAYETKGDLSEAVVRFADWLTNLTVEKEAATGRGSGSVKLVLLGHSMGGLLIADTFLEFRKSRKEGDPLWPNIVACIAYDTPYYGLHPHIFKNQANKAVEHLNAAKTAGSALFGSLATLSTKKDTTPSNSPPPSPSTPSSMWGTAAVALGGALFAGAAAGSAYWKKNELVSGYSWMTDHMKYVGNLWDKAGMEKRMQDLSSAVENDKLAFANFYTYIPATPPARFQPRTFIVVPKVEDPLETCFIKSQNHLATDEISAHTGMFSGGTNGGFYELGLNTGKAIQAAFSSLDQETKALEA